MADRGAAGVTVVTIRADVASLRAASDPTRLLDRLEPSPPPSAPAGAGEPTRDHLVEVLARAAEVVGHPTVTSHLTTWQAGVEERVGGWHAPDVTVLELPGVDGAPRTLVVTTAHLAHHLAELLGLGPRARSHEVGGPLQLPGDVLESVARGVDGPWPPDLPAPWQQVLTRWSRGEARPVRLAVSGQEPTWVVDDPASGWWIGVPGGDEANGADGERPRDGRRPAERSDRRAATVVLAPASATDVLLAVTTAFDPPPV